MKHHSPVSSVNLHWKILAPRLLLLLSGSVFTAANAAQTAQEQAHTIQPSEEQRRRTPLSLQRGLDAPNVDLGLVPSDLFSSWPLYKPRHFPCTTPVIGFNLNYQY